MAWWEYDEEGDSVLVSRKRGMPYATIRRVRGDHGSMTFVGRAFNGVERAFDNEEAAELYVLEHLQQLRADLSELPGLYAPPPKAEGT